MLLNLVTAADRERYHPKVVCLHTIGELEPRFAAAGVEVAMIDRPASGGRGTLASLIRYLRQERPDILHTHNRGPHQHGAFARRAVGVGVHVHTRHDRSHAATWKSRLIERAATRLTDRIVPVSEDAARVAMEWDGARPSQLEVIANGVDLTSFPAKQWEDRSWRAVHVARLDAVKDQATLLRAAAIVAALEPRFHLDIVGDGPERSKLEILCANLGLSRVVTFHGMQNDVRPYLASAELFVLSSLSEGLAMTLLEAMAASLPIVATAVGGNCEAVVPGENGELVPPGDPEALAQALLGLLSSPERLYMYSAAARKRAEAKYSLETMANNYHDLYDGLMDGRRSVTHGVLVA